MIAKTETHAIEPLAFLPWKDAAGSAAEDLPADSLGRILLKTSGTTGDFNVVPFTEADIGAQSARHAEYRDERLLRLASVEYNNSKRHRLYSLWNGGTNIFRPRTASAVTELVHRHQVTCLDISRIHASDLAAAGTGTTLAHVKIRTGGSAIPIDVRRLVERNVTPELYVRYATTESGAISMAGPGQHDDDEVVGVPLPGVVLEIVDANGKALSPGETGEIRVQAAGMALGYLDSPTDTAKRFRDGWFWPGDVGTLRADGQVIVNGRADDMMILNGVNIFPAEIERVLERHHAVRIAAALPIPSKVHGHIPVAAVELHAEATTTAAELQDYARTHLALRAPRRILIVDALPRNSQGKIMRREIAKSFQPAGPS